jgi:hypothetical protein
VQRRWLVIVTLLAAGAFSAYVVPHPSAAPERAAACGEERWAVKTLQDDAGKALDLSVIEKTTVAALRSKPKQPGPGGSRGEEVESTFFEVRARLVSAKLEEDNDIHLVIKGITTSGTMIVEFPLAPTCTANATAGAKTRMKNSRNAFGAACGVPGVSSFTKLKGRATIRGIGFFDFFHNQTGVAPNEIELHPVLRFMDAICEVVS